MTEFHFNDDGQLVIGEGYEAAWDRYYTILTTKYADVMSLKESHVAHRLGYNVTMCSSPANCKIVLVLFNDASEELQWEFIHKYPEEIRELLIRAPRQWKVFNMLTPEMHSYLKITM